MGTWTFIADLGITDATATVEVGSAWGVEASFSGSTVHFDWTVPPGGTAWYVGALPNASDLNTITPGVYRTQTSAASATLVNAPSPLGGPITLTVTPGSTQNGIVHQQVIVWGVSSFVVWERVSLSGVFGPWAEVEAPRTAIPNMVTVLGDSQVAGDGSWTPSQPWPAVMANSLGATVTNLGRSGDTTDEILLRCGFLDVYLTVAGGTIPASGLVNVSSTQKVGVTRERTFPGTLAGVAGTLRWDETGATTFNRTGTGTAVPVSGPVKFVSSGGGSGRRREALIYWGGRNDVIFATSGVHDDIVTHIVAGHQRVEAAAQTIGKRVLHVGISLATTEPAGSLRWQQVTDANAAVKRLFPDTFVDVNAYLIDHGLAAAGITPTSADLAAIAAREMPPSLTSDGLHFPASVHASVLAPYFASQLRARGWVA